MPTLVGVGVDRLTHVWQALGDGAISGGAGLEIMGRHAGEGRALYKARRKSLWHEVQDRVR